MVVKNNSKGISLISLIITIIVIIILSAIVIFSGMDTPEKAQLSKVISDIDNVQTAVDQAYYGLYTEKAVAGEVWTQSQFYEAVATGETDRNKLSGDGLIEIGENSLVDINLPVYEGRKWYVAVSDMSDTVKVGSAVLSPGFESQGKTYATLLDIQNGGSDGNGANGGNQSGLTPEESAKLARIEIGDYVEGYMDVEPGVNWRVIDKNEATGEILITTSNAVGSYALNGAKDYIDIATRGENSKLNQYCKTNYSAGKGETSARSMTIEDMDKLCELYGISKTDYSDCRSAYYPSGSKGFEVTGKKNGKTIRYYGENHGNYFQSPYDGENKGIFLTYDIVDSKGEVITYTATKLEESKVAGDGGYRVLEKDKPVLVSTDYYWYDIPSEVQEVVGSSDSWLASTRVMAVSTNADFGVGKMSAGYVSTYSLCDSCGLEYNDSLGIHPVVSLRSKLLEEGSADNSWKIK